MISGTVDNDEHGEPINPMDAHFRALRLTSMEPVARKSAEFNTLETYVRDTHGATHHINVEILNAFRVERQDETDAWLKAGNHQLADGERLLLWHGSRTTNFAGILKQGLRIAPPEGKRVICIQLSQYSLRFPKHLSPVTCSARGCILLMYECPRPVCA